MCPPLARVLFTAPPPVASSFWVDTVQEWVHGFLAVVMTFRAGADANAWDQATRLHHLSDATVSHLAHMSAGEADPQAVAAVMKCLTQYMKGWLESPAPPPPSTIVDVAASVGWDWPSETFSEIPLALTLAQALKQLAFAATPPPSTASVRYPPLDPPPFVSGCVERSEARRILRCSHAFGTLSLPWHLPVNSNVLTDRWEMAMDRLERSSSTSSPETRRWATAKLEAALNLLSNQAEQSNVRERLRVQPRPIIATIRCPIDVESLSMWRETDAADALPVHKDGTSYGRSGRALATALLDAASRERDAGGRVIGYIDVQYRHSEKGQAAIDAGWLTHSRLLGSWN